MVKQAFSFHLRDIKKCFCNVFTNRQIYEEVFLLKAFTIKYFVRGSLAEAIPNRSNTPVASTHPNVSIRSTMLDIFTMHNNCNHVILQGSLWVLDILKMAPGFRSVLSEYTIGTKYTYMETTDKKQWNKKKHQYRLYHCSLQIWRSPHETVAFRIHMDLLR